MASSKNDKPVEASTWAGRKNVHWVMGAAQLNSTQLNSITPEEAREHLRTHGKFDVENGRVVEVDRYALSFLRTEASKNEERVRGVRARLADTESRKTLDRLRHGTPNELFQYFAKSVFETVQYFELVEILPGAVIVNGGVQEGTARVINIDPSGFSKLDSYIQATVQHYEDRFDVVPKAIWNHTGQESLPVASNGAVLSQFT